MMAHNSHRIPAAAQQNGKLGEASRLVQQLLNSPQEKMALASVLAQRHVKGNNKDIRLGQLCFAASNTGSCGQTAQPGCLTCSAHKDTCVLNKEGKALQLVSPLFAALLEKQSTTFFKTKASLTAYKRTNGLEPAKAAQSQQCNATAPSSGKRCKKMTLNADGYCHVKTHRDQCERPILATPHGTRRRQAPVAPRKKTAPAPRHHPVSRRLFQTPVPSSTQLPAEEDPMDLSDDEDEELDFFDARDEPVEDHDNNFYYVEEEEEEPVPLVLVRTQSIPPPLLCKHMKLNASGEPNACWRGDCKHNCKGCQTYKQERPFDAIPAPVEKEEEIHRDVPASLAPPALCKHMKLNASGEPNACWRGDCKHNCNGCQTYRQELPFDDPIPAPVEHEEEDDHDAPASLAPLCKHMKLLKSTGAPNACWRGDCNHKTCQGCVDRQEGLR